MNQNSESKIPNLRMPGIEKFLRKNWRFCFWGLVGMSFLARVFASLTLSDTNPLTANLWEYGQIAKLAMEHGGQLLLSKRLPNGSQFLYPTAYMPPLQIFIWMGLFKWLGVSKAALTSMIAVNVLLATASTYYVVKITERLFSSRSVALLTGLFFAFNPVFVYSVTLYHSLNLYILLLLIIFDILADGKAINIKTYVIAGMLTGLAALARTEYLILAGAIHLSALISHRNWRLTAVSIITTVAVIAPWTARNYVTLEKFIVVANSAGFNLHKGFNPEANGSGDWVDNHGVRERLLGDELKKVPFDKDYESNTDKVFRTAAVNFIQSNPIESFVILPAKKIFLFWLYDIHDPVTKLPLYQLQFWPLFILSVYGLIAAARAGHFSEPNHRAIFLLFAFQTVVMMGYAVHARYRMSVEPFLFAYAAYGLVRLLGRWPSRRTTHLSTQSA